MSSNQLVCVVCVCVAFVVIPCNVCSPVDAELLVSINDGTQLVGAILQGSISNSGEYGGCLPVEIRSAGAVALQFVWHVRCIDISLDVPGTIVACNTVDSCE